MAILGDTKAVSLSLLDGVIGDLNPKITTTYNLGTSSLKWNNIYGTLKGNADTATTATKLGSTTIGSNVKAIYLNNGTATASDYEFAGGYLKNNANLNALYDAGFYSSPGGSVTNYPANGGAYASTIVVPYRKPSGNSTPDYAFQIADFTQNKSTLWFRTSNSSAWSAWQNFVHITANTAVGGTTTPVYVDKDGKVTALSYTIAKSVPSNAKFTDTTYSAGSGLTLSSTTINHTNSVTAQTTQAIYPIKIDAQGHISAYGSAVTIPNPVQVVRLI